MSIINDALKKVQNNLNAGKKAPEQPPSQTASTPPPSTSDIPPATEPALTQPISPEEPPLPPEPWPVPSEAVKPKESNSLVYVLVSLCLLIALFAPILEHKSVFGLITHMEWKRPQSSQTATSAPVTAPPVPSTPAVAAPQVPPSATPNPVVEKAAAITENIANSLVNFNNPAAAPNASRTTSVRRILLNGIMAQGDKNVALIDGQVYEAGETVDGVTIIAINPNNIVIEEHGRQRTVKVGQ